MSKSDQQLAKQEAQIKQLRESLLRPVAERFGFPLGGRGRAVGMPTVLCLGNHSSGKSTFVNHLAGSHVQDTGVAPTDDGFTLITYGPSEETLDGRAVVADPSLPYQDLEQFGKDFVDHLKLKRRPSEALKNVCLIDSPGMIDHAGDQNDASRGYDFQAVVRWFAESADLIIFFFDPDKPGTTGESLRIFTDSLDNVMYKLLIVFNKVDTFEDVRDFARTYGALCWNLSRIVRTKDMPHIYCTFISDARAHNGSIDLSDFEKSTQELKSEIARVGQRRRSNLVSSLLDSGRQLRMHASVSRRAGWRLMLERAGLWTTTTALAAAGVAAIWFLRDHNYGIGLGVVLILLAIGLGIAIQSIMAMRLNHHIALLDKYFREEFGSAMLKQQNTRFVEGLWETVRPRTEHFLRTEKASRLPFSPFWQARFRKVDYAIENEIPELLKKLSSTPPE